MRKERDQRQARKQHVGAALGGLGNQAGQPALEERPCHDAVLQGECAEQQDVNEQRLARVDGRRAVHGHGHDEIADEAQRIEESDEKDDVADHAVQKKIETLEHDVLRLKTGAH
jgi:hypothetical protein